MAYAAKKKRYLAEFRSAMPLLIAIGLKQRPETSEVEEFRSAFRLFDGEEEQRIVRTPVEMLKRFDNDQAVAAAEKEFKESQEIEASLLKILMDSTRPEIGQNLRGLG
jgi:Ca2+-binding EF-hand superfamily protein